LTVVAAKEFARYGIRVNAVAPGTVDIGMMKEMSDEAHKKYISEIPLTRYAEPLRLPGQ